MASVEADVDSSVRYVRFDLLPDLSADSVKCWAGKARQRNTCLVTDGYSNYLSMNQLWLARDKRVICPVSDG
jgi:hypothetical protein